MKHARIFLHLFTGQGAVRNYLVLNQDELPNLKKENKKTARSRSDQQCVNDTLSGDLWCRTPDSSIVA